jgi:glycopeptide antibiotics resistance protein
LKLKRISNRSAWLRGVAWLAALLVAAWILSMTLASTGTRADVRFTAANTNLVPFSRKWPALLCLFRGCESPGQRRASIAFLFVDVLGNLAVFAPFGMAVAAATLPPRSSRSARRQFGWRWWAGVAGAGALFSLSIELAQLFIPTRATDIDDLILNTLGAVAGAALFRLFLSLR